MSMILDTLRRERQKYGTVMSEVECVNLLNTACWHHRDERWMLSGKTFGNRAQRYDGVECSVDVITQRPEHPRYEWDGIMVDVLRAAGADSEPVWNLLGENTQTNRPRVAPIEPREPGERVILSTKLGATCFSLVDLYQHQRARCDETLARLRVELGARFLRVFWRKGTGSPGDYWNNDDYYSLVRTDLNQLPVSLMREVMHYVAEQGLTIAHCIFADSLGMSLSDQDRFRDGFIDAVTSVPRATEYIEVFNEPYTRGGGHGGEMGELQHHARALRRALGPSVLISLGTPQSVHATGDIETEVRDMYGACPEANLITVHFSRETNNPQLAPELSHFAPRRRSNGEPIGPGSSVAQTTDADALVENFRETNRRGYEWYVYHDHYLIRPRGSNIWERPEWPAIAAGLKTVAGGGAPTPKPKPLPGAPMPLPDRGRVMRFLEWLHAYYKSDEGLRRPQGLWVDDRPDFEGIGAWVFDVFLNAIIRGASDDTAKAAVIREIEASEEWKAKHP
jgi:hypothetical protein